LDEGTPWLTFAGLQGFSQAPKLTEPLENGFIFDKQLLILWLWSRVENNGDKVETRFKYG